MTGVELIGALASDYLATSGSPFPSVGGLMAGNLLACLMRKRAETARDILIEELRHGARTQFDIDEEEAASVVFRFFRAATEGAARLNLGLMGSCMVAGASADRLHADLFLRWADILASLRREEVHLLAVCKTPSVAALKEDAAWTEVRRLMTSTFGYTDRETDAYAASMLRTGCLVPVPTWDVTSYETTILFTELSSLIDIDGVIQRHDNL